MRDTEEMRILQLCRIPVYPPRNGATVRVSKTAEKLAELGTLSLATPPHTEASPPSAIEQIPLDTMYLTERLLRNEGWLGLFALGDNHPLQRRLTEAVRSAIERRNQRFDLVVSEFPQVSRAAREIATEHGAKLLVNKHNAAAEILDSFLERRPVPDVIRKRAVANLQAFERRTVETADIAVFQSSSDAARFSDIEGTVTKVIPNGCEYERIRQGGNPEVFAQRLGIQPETSVCIFVGSYGYKPNREAATAIINDLAPAHPDVAFLLVGQDPPEADCTNVYTLGYEEDLAGVLKFADIALCPLFSGSGTKLKMLDYLAAGLPVVTTPVGAQGLPVSHMREVLMYDTIAGFNDGINQLVSEDGLAAQLADRGQKVAADHSWTTLMSEYESILDQLLVAGQ
jgi:glycosyltransferase involved in cell wall biosynthesis